MDILLLGGTGTLSSAVRDLSLKKDYNVAVFNRGNSNNSIPCDVKIFIGDFRNKEVLTKSFKDRFFDVVIDFLSRTSPDIERVFPIFQGKCKQYIFISSACVYQRTNSNRPLTEDSEKPNHDWKYSEEKYECEKKLVELSKNNNSTYYTIVRPYITFDDERIPLGISPSPYRLHRTVIERIKSGKPWFVWDSGTGITNVTHASDFAVGVVGLFLNEKAKNEDFNITGDNSCTHRQLIEALFEKLRVVPNIIDIKTTSFSKRLPEYKGMLIADRALDAKFDNAKIKEAVPELRFKITISKGLDRVLHYWDDKPSYNYDYRFEGRIDRLLSQYTKVEYVKYPHAKSSSVVIYYLYRYIPLRWASKIAKYVK